MSTLKVDNIRHNSATSDAITMASDGTCTAKLTSIGGGGLSHRNLIINGGMSVSQRHGTSETTPAHTEFGPDRMKFDLAQSSKLKVQQVTDAPAGFSHSMKVTSLSAYSSGASDYFLLQNMIEGTDSARLRWGTSDAQTVTLSFYVKSSLTGVHACGIRNNPYNRGNTQTYTINNANTWERKTVTFTGDTSGSWNVDINAGLKLNFDLGSGSNFQAASTGTWLGTNDFITSNSVKVVGTNAATWYITGIQLEVGDTATSFEHRSIGEELARCQRYCVVYGGSGARHLGTAHAYNSTNLNLSLHVPVPMRAGPTPTTVLASGNWLQAYMGATGVSSNASINVSDVDTNHSSMRVYLQNAHSGRTEGQALWLHTLPNAKLILSAEL